MTGSVKEGAEGRGGRGVEDLAADGAAGGTAGGTAGGVAVDVKKAGRCVSSGLEGIGGSGDNTCSTFIAPADEGLYGYAKFHLFILPKSSYWCILS